MSGQRITRKSAKAKARRLQDKLAQMLLTKFSFLQESDVRPAIMGESGEDMKISSIARDCIPFSFECKNRERLNIWDALAQAEANAQEDTIPVAVFKRNRSEEYVALKLKDFIQLF